MTTEETLELYKSRETSEKIAPKVIKGKGSIGQYPEWDEEEDNYN